MIGLLISIFVLALIIGVIFWCLTLLPVPQPFLNIIKVIVVLICLLYLIGMLPSIGWYHPLYR